MNARDLEELLLNRCAAAAHGTVNEAIDQREANVFMLAAMILSPGHEVEEKRFRRISEEYFSRRQQERLMPDEIFDNGWILGFSRFRDMLTRRIEE